MAKASVKKKPAAKPAAAVTSKPKSKAKAKPAGWRSAATYLVEKLTGSLRFRKDYAARRGLDSTAAIARLDKELARLKIPYTAKYLGMRNGRATFRIRVAAKHGFAMWEAVDRV